MRYFAKITRTYTPKNNLEKAILKAMEPKDRTILEDPDNVVQFMDEIKEILSHLNWEYPRCKPAEIDRIKDETGKYPDEFVPQDQFQRGDLFFRINGVFYMEIYREGVPQ